jgi:anti-sigma regulatory factor (Ser/Thr protein kinase)
MHLLKYKNENYKKLIFNISDKAPLNAILKYINLFDSEISGEKQEHIIFSIMELVNNSLRAHREKEIKDKPIKIKLESTEKSLIIEILDFGKGFDLNDLPYDYFQDPNSIDNQSSEFQKYREKFEYKRFGMGLLTAKKLFDSFLLDFHSHGKLSKQYDPNQTEGTIIKLGVNWPNE